MPIGRIVRYTRPARHLAKRESARPHLANQSDCCVEKCLAEIFAMVGLDNCHATFLSDYVDTGNIFIYSYVVDVNIGTLQIGGSP